jgi:hypothetical protein
MCLQKAILWLIVKGQAPLAAMWAIVCSLIGASRLEMSFAPTNSSEIASSRNPLAQWVPAASCGSYPAASMISFKASPQVSVFSGLNDPSG